MSMEAFCVPLPGRCLSPLPTMEPAFKKGDLVAWQDGEAGVVSSVTEHAVCVFWEESQSCWYPLNSIAATERITVLEKEDWV
jgi:hypothetical protein